MEEDAIVAIKEHLLDEINIQIEREDGEKSTDGFFERTKETLIVQLSYYVIQRRHRILCRPA